MFSAWVLAIVGATVALFIPPYDWYLQILLVVVIGWAGIMIARDLVSHAGRR